MPANYEDDDQPMAGEGSDSVTEDPAVREFFLPATAAGSFSSAPAWPKRLRIHRLNNTEIYPLTWNFASPDGRATFHLDKMDDGEPLLVWRRIGDHAIYKNP